MKLKELLQKVDEPNTYKIKALKIDLNTYTLY